MNFIRIQCKDFLQYVFVPLLAALMPWPLARRWMQWWSRRAKGPFNEAARPASLIAPQYMQIGDVQVFAYSCRLIWLLDAYDFYLSITRWPRSWWPKHVSQSGAWPTDRPYIATGFHHGTGMWIFRSIAQTGFDSLLVSARWLRSEFIGYPLRYWYGRMRCREIERVSGRKVAMRPNAREKLMHSLASGTPVIGVIDMPPRMAPRGQRPVRVIDRNISFPEGLLTIARESKVPIVPYWIEFDLQHCTRRLCIGTPLDPADQAGTLQALADILDAQIRRTPEAWFFWPELPRWIEDAAHVDGVENGGSG
ncbi:MAG: hypothetical protein ABJB01_09510 [Rudaea sp.]